MTIETNYAIDSNNCDENKMIRRLLQMALVAMTGAALFAVVLPTAAAAEDPDELLDSLSEEEELKVITLIDEGQEKYDAGDFQGALDIFNELYELFPHPDVNYRVALCYERLGEDEMAVQHYRQFLEQVPDASERGRIERTIETLESRIGDDSAGVRVETYPIGARIFVDNRDTAPVGETPQNVQLAPGATYQIYVEKEGYEPKQESVTIVEGEMKLLQMRMTSDDRDEQRQIDESSVSAWKPIGSVAMVGFGGLSLFLARGHYEEVREMDNCRNTELSCQSIDPNDRDRERNMAIGLGVVGGAAILGATAFTTWWVVSGRSSEPSFGVGPASPDGDGISVSFHGRF